MTDRTISWAAGELAAHLAHRARLVALVLEDDPASPGAQSFEQDRTSGHSTVLFCWEHEQDPKDCHTADRWEGDTKGVERTSGHPCTGEPIPMATDTVGELVASGRTGRAKAILAQVEAAETQVIKAVQALDRLHDRFGPARDLPVRAMVEGRSRDGDPGCQSCARLTVGEGDEKRPWWNEPTYNKGRPWDFGGALPTRMLLCEACARWALNHDHDRCIEHNESAKAKKSPLKAIRFAAEVHLPPVSGAFESLELRQRTGYWRGKPGRAVERRTQAVDLPTPTQRRRERLAEGKP